MPDVHSQLSSIKTRLKDAAKEAGNVLFIILLAVALFAALAYTVTQSTRSGGGDASREQMKLQIGAIQQFATSARTALMRMHVSGGYEFWQIDYYKADYSGNMVNTNCTIPSCMLHNPQGGGIGGMPTPIEFRDPSNSNTLGKYHFSNIGIKGIGIDTQRDLLLFYPGVTKSLCIAVNDANGVTNPAGNPVIDNVWDESGGGYATYDGALSSELLLTSAPELGVKEPSMAGKTMFCSDMGNGLGYWIWIVLIER